MQTSSRTKGHGSTGNGAPRRPDLGLTPARRTLRVPWMVLGLAVMVACSAAFAAWASRTGERLEALAVARDVTAGEALGPDDVTTIRVGADKALSVMTQDDLDLVLGRVALSDLPAHTLLGPALVAPASPVDPDEALVGVSLPAGELPAVDLVPGATVLVVGAERDAGAAVGQGVPTPPAIWPAEVFAVSEGDPQAVTREVYVSLRLPTRVAPAVAAAAARDSVRLLLVSSLDDVPGDLFFSDALPLAPEVSIGEEAPA